MNVDFPFHFDSHGRTARTDDADHIRDMIEELLFTSPGERVNRPAFGGGLRRLVFEPNSPEFASALEFMLQSAIQQHLQDLILLQGLTVSSEDSTLSITVQYRLHESNEIQQATIERTNVS